MAMMSANTVAAKIEAEGHRDPVLEVVGHRRCARMYESPRSPVRRVREPPPVLREERVVEVQLLALRAISAGVALDAARGGDRGIGRA